MNTIHRALEDGTEAVADADMKALTYKTGSGPPELAACMLPVPIQGAGLNVQSLTWLLGPQYLPQST